MEDSKNNPTQQVKEIENGYQEHNRTAGSFVKSNGGIGERKCGCYKSERDSCLSKAGEHNAIAGTGGSAPYVWKWDVPPKYIELVLIWQRWVRRYGPPIFISQGRGGNVFRRKASSPALSLLRENSKSAFDAGHRLLSKKNVHHSTRKQFWEYAQSDSAEIITIRGTDYYVPNLTARKKIHELFMFYATCEMRDLSTILPLMSEGSEV
tara:strand:+ start:3858 stop:4481 length:624 start_codon:yes stop_codon:yes gene_type:complete